MLPGSPNKSSNKSSGGRSSRVAAPADARPDRRRPGWRAGIGAPPLALALSLFALSLFALSLLSLPGLSLSAIPGLRPAAPPLWEPLDYPRALGRLDASIAGLEARAEAMPTSWTALEWAAAARLERARLSGSLDDYAAAEALLTRAFARAGAGSGPHLARARLHLALHRPDAAEADLRAAEARPLATAGERAAQRLLRADLAFARGRYPEARSGYEELLAEAPGSGARPRLALYHAATGDPQTALALLAAEVRATRSGAPETRAWLHLQQGLVALAGGRYRDALRHYRDADAVFPGWWLITEHIAEIHLLQGRPERAEVGYRQALAATGRPEFMDALALVALERGDERAARDWIARARQQHEATLARFPEAAAGHALDHFLQFDADPARALDLAERNHRLRPDGDARTRLAQALFRAGRLDDALRVIEEALAGPWRSAELHATAARLYAAAGAPERAARERARATAIDPHAPALLEWLQPPGGAPDDARGVRADPAGARPAAAGL